ncbi:pre-rRNA-processing protein TSR1 [Perkinsela sp. CCAP 1560/4]|nr:pre-rRNA-processing protein TSR1 [Perkinsela sp. CCAP 1560/4]|eukprot:KNH07325.1 pre-rRNA-processing protein TSR1 [Perkinsela sp. CCAP 1560/4]
MVSQRNKAHKNRFRSKGKLKNKSKGKKVQNRFRVVGNDSDFTQKAVCPSYETETSRKQADTRKSRAGRKFSPRQIEGFVKVASAAPSNSQKKRTDSDKTHSIPQPSSYRVAALLPLNKHSRGAGVIQSFTKNHFQILSGSDKLPGKQSIMHDGGLITFLDPFARLWDDSSTALEVDRIDFAAVMDTLLVADMIIFVVSLENGETELVSPQGVWYGDLGLSVDALGRHMISLVNAIGAPGIFVSFHRPIAASEDRTSDRKFHAVVKLHKRYLCSVLPSKYVSLASAYHTSSTKAAMSKFWRALNESKLDVVKWRTNRPYMLVEDHSFIPDEGNADKGTLVVGGYLRGSPLSVNQLVTVGGMDTQSFKIASISTLDKMLMPDDGAAVEAPLADVSESGLVLPYSSVNPSEMLLDGEFSSADEVMTDEDGEGGMSIDELPASREDNSVSKMFQQSYRTLKVPEGVSGYQAAWYDYDENVVDVDESATVDSKSRRGESQKPAEGSYLSTRNLHRLGTTDGPMDEEDVSSQDGSASEANESPTVRQRFYKYRPLPTAMMPTAMNSTNAVTASSFSAVFTNRFSAKSSANYWDPYQNLPDAYAKLFSLPLTHFRKNCKEALSGADVSVALQGERINVLIANVPLREHTQLAGRSPVIFSGLLPHEEKLSLLHGALTGMQNTLFAEPTDGEDHLPTLESKHSMVFQVGFRRYRARGMFYADCPQGNQGELRLATFNEQMPTGKKVMETILQRRATYCKDYCPSGPAGTSYCVAHYGPMTHIPVPVFILQNRSLVSPADAAVGQTQHLICTTGRALAPDPHLLLLKKRRLIGKIYKVHQGSAVIKKMFMDDQDVKYFEKIELRTLRGVKGRIIKSIGTHGTFKAKFNAVVQQHDKVYIDLFKRVFPPSYEASSDDV